MNGATRALRLSIIVLVIVLGARLSAAASTTAVAAPPAQIGAASAPGPRLVLRALPTNSFTAVDPPAGFRSGLRVQTATITVTYVNFPPEAQAAFQYAVDIWETLITSPVPIEVTATWEQLGPGILGSAGATYLVRDFPNAPAANTWYPVALGNKLAGSDLVPSAGDISASFNSDFTPSWYFGTDGNTPMGKYDFTSVVLHELGHGLGFFGSMFVSGGSGSWGCGNGFPCIYDRFTENGAGQSLINTALFPNPSAALATQLTSNNIFFDGPNANAANNGNRPKLYAPSPFQPGSSYSHLDEATYPAGNLNSLMTPAIGSAESIHDPGPITLGIFQDMGWSLNGPPPSVTLTVTKNGSGTVTSTSPPSPVITCGATCSASYVSGTVVTLAATPADGWLFSGWSGACTGSGACSVTMNADRSVTATFTCSRNCPPPPTTFVLSVAKSGTGTGTVTSTSPPSPSITCGATCSASYPSGTMVTLTATPSADSTFAGWSGTCGGTGNCVVTMDAAKSVTATFNLTNPPPSFTLTVSKAGTGTGTVTSTSPPSPSITCGATCSASYPSGTVVTLAATAAAGSQFAGWSGACGGTGSCTVTMDAAKSVTATFTLIPCDRNCPPPPTTFVLSVAKSGTGTGTVTSTSPPSPSINCGATCSAAYPSGTLVSLTATPSADSTFAGWSGACGGTGTCTVTMDAAKSVTATFNLTNPPASFTLTVTKNGQGTVVSTSPPSPSITCGATCAASYASGTVVTLAATPSAGWVFTGWSGACTGTGSCSVTMDAAKSVTATFVPGRS